jgi:hypothetical protein
MTVVTEGRVDSLPGLSVGKVAHYELSLPCGRRKAVMRVRECLWWMGFINDARSVTLYRKRVLHKANRWPVSGGGFVLPPGSLFAMHVYTDHKDENLFLGLLYRPERPHWNEITDPDGNVIPARLFGRVSFTPRPWECKNRTEIRL